MSRAPHWVLHPRTTALVLLALVLAGVAAAAHGAAGAGPLLATTAGFAAGFANSGST